MYTVCRLNVKISTSIDRSFLRWYRRLAAKVVELDQDYSREAYEKTEKHTGRVYEAGKEKSQELHSCQEEIRFIN